MSVDVVWLAETIDWPENIYLKGAYATRDDAVRGVQADHAAYDETYAWTLEADPPHPNGWRPGSYTLKAEARDLAYLVWPETVQVVPDAAP